MKQYALSVALSAYSCSPSPAPRKQEGGIPGTPNSFTLKVERSISVSQGEKKQLEIRLIVTRSSSRGLDLEAAAGQRLESDGQVDRSEDRSRTSDTAPGSTVSHRGRQRVPPVSVDK